MPAGGFLERVERGIAAAVTTRARPGRPDVLAEAAAHLCLSPGAKRMRPRLVELLGAALGAPAPAQEDVAVAAELIHAASLLHDDVVDEGETRRGVPTVNAQWGNAVAVLAGDWLLSAAFARLRSHAPAVTASAVETIAAMSRAAIAEVEARGDAGLPLDAWREIAAGKTGALFGWCGAALAHAAGDSGAAHRLERFGRHLGVAFQMADDLKDLVGGALKDRFADLRNKNPSFPALLACEDRRLRARVATAWARPAVPPAAARRLGEAVIASGAVEATVVELELELAAAMEALGPWQRQTWAVELREWAGRFAEGVLRTPRGAHAPSQEGAA